MTLAFELDLDSLKTSQRAECHKSFSSKVVRTQTV